MSGVPTKRDVIEQLRGELRAKDRELEELRERLRAIHTSDAWAMLRTLAQVREAVAPRGTWRDEWARRGARGLRRAKKAVARAARTSRAALRVFERRGAAAPHISPRVGDHHAVICLPMIEWGFRFQRPQQLMRQFALRDHLVLYASNQFHRGATARERIVADNVLEVTLPGDPAANVYQTLPADRDHARMTAAMAGLLDRRSVQDATIIVQHPYWTRLAEELRDRFGWIIVYDCMDDHAGFLHNSAAVLETERRLLAGADLVAASSGLLFENARERARAAVLVRNACEFEHFASARKTSVARPEAPRVGYYGAIAEWFDSGLVARLARLRPGWRFELIGSTLAGDVRALEGLANVRLLGERPYSELPRLIAGWDACVIPFRRVPLTEATNPVKVYEMLAAGKPVTAVELPELVPIAREGLIRLAATAEEFALAIEDALNEQNAEMVAWRQAFARANTWEARHRELAAAIARLLQERDQGRIDDAGPARGPFAGAA